MTEHIHILPVGEDIRRLTIPITTGTVDVDTAILLTPEVDANQADQKFERAYQSTPDIDFKRHVSETIERILEDHGVEVEKIDDQPSYDDYAEVYECAYDLFQAHSTDERVAVNISSLPQAAAVAFGAAATTIASEDLDRGRRVRVYHVPADRNIGAEACHHLRAVQDSFDEFQELGIYYLEHIEWPVFERFLDTIDTELKVIQDRFEEIDETVPQRVQTDDRYVQFREECESYIDDIEQAFGEGNFRWMREEGFQEYSYEPEWNDEFREALQTARADLELPRDLVTDILDHLDGFESLLDKAWEVREWSVDFFGRHSDLGQFNYRARDLIGDLDHYGLHQPRQTGTQDQSIITCSPAPTKELKDIERLIVQALYRQGSFTAISELADTIAEYVFQQALEPVADPESVSVLRDDAKTQLERLFDRHDPSVVLEELKDQLQERLRSRLQYNLDSLEKSGYIVREQDDDDKRRKRTELSPTGSLWALSHDLDEVCRKPVAEIAASEIERYSAASPDE